MGKILHISDFNIHFPHIFVLVVLDGILVLLLDLISS